MRVLSAACLAIFSVSMAGAQGLAPIKASNQVGADLDLMDNHDPEVERQSFDVLDGFEVNLFAAEPMLENPVHMVWGPRGRLWVACSWSYPQLRPGERPNDQIIILEDTDGDGTADKSTVFADGLYIPTGIELANGGVYVGQTPDILFLKDTDGDDRADIRQVALTGFGIEDSHHSISAWRRGPGGWIYFQEGLFIRTQVPTLNGIVRNNDGGVYQFKPQTGEFRVFANLSVGNPWGHVFDYWGQSFLVDNPRINYLSPSTGNGGVKIGAFTLISTQKQCGGDLISGSHMPPELYGQLMSGRFKSRAVIRYGFDEDGSAFKASELTPLVSAKHPNFRPVDVKMGPDGAVYVADWYNPIINHAQHDFRDPRRDAEHGRIWRITAKGRPLAEKPDLLSQSIEELVANLQSEELWVRDQSRLVLTETDLQATLRALAAWSENLDPSDPNYDHHIIEGLWLYQSLDEPNEAYLRRALELNTGQARAAATRLIRYWHRDLSDPIGIVAQMASDPFPRTRMEAVLAAGFLEDARALPAALNALDYPVDKAIESALEQTSIALASFVKPLLEDGALAFSEDRHRDYALRAAGLGFGQRLESYLSSWSGTNREVSSLWSELSRSGQSDVLALAIDALSQRRQPPKEHALGLMNALSRVSIKVQFPLRGKMLAVSRYMKSPDDELVSGALQLLSSWKIDEAAPALYQILGDDSRPLDLRHSAAAAIGRLEQKEHMDRLAALFTDSSDPQARYLASYGMMHGDIEVATPYVAEALQSDSRAADPEILIREYASRDGGFELLKAALGERSLHTSVRQKLKAYVNRVGLISPELSELLESHDSGSLAERLLAEDVSVLASDALEQGDPFRGEILFRKTSLACASCHAIGGAGPSVGPDLTAIGSAAPAEYIVESILLPNKALAEHFENFSLVTRDGGAYVGSLVFRNERQVTIKDAISSQEVTIARNRIRKMTEMPSLMPAGLANQLKNRQEFLDLTSFVAQLGRPGPFAVSKAQVIRKWDAAESAIAPESMSDQSIHDIANWQRHYSRARGELSIDASESSSNSIIAKGNVEVNRAGSIRLNLEGARDLRLWIDGQEVADLDGSIEIAGGLREFVFVFPASSSPAYELRVELIDGDENPARYQVVGGL